jgi:glycosyltransferase involved in cell wall biosynthesis
VPEPIDLARWQSALAEAAAPREPATILTVCHLYPRKRVNVLIEAMRSVVARRPEAHLRIVGTGPEAGRLRQQAHDLGLTDHVTLTGHLPFAELVAAYRRAALFCLPSVQEGFGIVLLEAMAAGLPIVACRAAAVPEVAPDGVCSLLVPPDDAAALAEALTTALDDERLRRQLGQAGAERVRRYDAALVAAEFLAALSPSAAR